MSTELVRAPIAVPPQLAQAGVTINEEHGVRSVMIPAELKQRYNIAQPVSEVTQADPDWSPRLVVVDLSAEQFHYNEQGKRSLTKNGILLLAHAAGIEVDVNPMPRDQLRETEIGFKAVATIRRSDGTLAHWSASKVADLVDEKAAIEGTNKKWPIEKAHLAAKTESKAILRAVSLALQLKRGGYQAAEMNKPFLIVGVSSTPADPEVRRLRALQAGDALAGRRSLPAPTVEPENSQYDEPAPVAQIAPAADVVDHVPAAAASAQSSEPAAVAGEMTAEEQAAGEHVIPASFGAAAEGKKVREARRPWVEHQAYNKTDYTPDQEPTILACRAWATFIARQPEPVA